MNLCPSLPVRLILASALAFALLSCKSASPPPTTSSTTSSSEAPPAPIPAPQPPTVSRPSPDVNVTSSGPVHRKHSAKKSVIVHSSPSPAPRPLPGAYEPPAPEMAPPPAPPPPREVTLGHPSPPPPPLREEHNGVVSMHIFYATDRSPAAPTVKGISYGPDENKTDNLSYGNLTVTIPPVHQAGELEAPSVFKLEFSENPAKHVILTQVTQQTKEAFFTDLHSAIAGAPRKDALLFIHGYNVAFPEAARRTAQLAYDLQFQGAPILYSWPSRASLSGYTADEESVQWTVPHLINFLQDLHDRTGANTIHIIAHSMGNRAILNALEILMREKSPVHFGQVVLAAPDVASSHFIQQIPIVQAAADHITLYASSRDQALAASQHVNHYPRAGQTGDLTVIPPVETIDASAVDTGFLGHSYFGQSVLVLKDMLDLIRDGLTAAHRSHLHPGLYGANTYWTFLP
jgi:esterase/lipase superfamily enzyme